MPDDFEARRLAQIQAEADAAIHEARQRVAAFESEYQVDLRALLALRSTIRRATDLEPEGIALPLSWGLRHSMSGGARLFGLPVRWVQGLDHAQLCYPVKRAPSDG